MTLYELFEQIPDPRSAQGRRHPLPSILTLAVVAMLAGARSLEAIAQFGRDRDQDFARTLGFTHWPTPCKATFHYVFQGLPAPLVEEAIRKWLKGRLGRVWKALAIDGKRLRGTEVEYLPGVHLLAAYAPEVGQVLGQLRVGASTNEHKAALQLLEIVPLEGKVVSGDAIFCQRELSQKVKEKGESISGQ